VSVDSTALLLIIQVRVVVLAFGHHAIGNSPAGCTRIAEKSTDFNAPERWAGFQTCRIASFQARHASKAPTD